MICYDYLTVDTDEPLTTEELDIYGEDGWLLCCETAVFAARGVLTRFARPKAGGPRFTPSGGDDLMLGERIEPTSAPEVPGHCRGTQ